MTARTMIIPCVPKNAKEEEDGGNAGRLGATEMILVVVEGVDVPKVEIFCRTTVVVFLIGSEELNFGRTWGVVA